MRDYQTKANQGGLPDSITAEKLGAGEANSTLTESKTAVQSSGQTLAPADGTAEVTNQLAKAMAIYGGGGGSYHIDTGAANAYVVNPVSPKVSPPAYFDGMSVTFKPGNTNTGASTVNVASLGVKSILMPDGSALSVGSLRADTYISIIYSSASNRFEVEDSFEMSLTQNGFYLFKSGMIIQWGKNDSLPAGNLVSYPIAFPIAAFVALALDNTSSNFSHGIVLTSNTQFTFYTSSGGSDAAYWAVIGH